MGGGVINSDDVAPICVDLDGTLIRNDITIWSTKVFVKMKITNIFKILYWLAFKGWAYVKKKVARTVKLDMNILEYNKPFLDFLIAERNSGTPLFLATASDEAYADKVARKLGIFDGVFASDGSVSLAGRKKAEKLCSIFGEKGFIYAGNSKDDLKVWEKSLECILVAPTAAALKGMKGKNYRLFE